MFENGFERPVTEIKLKYLQNKNIIRRYLKKVLNYILLKFINCFFEFLRYVLSVCIYLLLFNVIPINNTEL